MSGLAMIMDAVAASLDPLTSEIDGLQITGFMNPTPSPPSLDVYPADTSGLPVSMDGWEETVTVRARVSTPDDIAAQDVLLSMMDVNGPTSVAAALHAAGYAVDERSGYQTYPGDYLGCEWRVRTIQ